MISEQNRTGGKKNGQSKNIGRRDVYKRQAYMITSFEDAERYFGRKADKNRKIYNGMLKTYFYQFQGPKPPRQKR